MKKLLLCIIVIFAACGQPVTPFHAAVSPNKPVTVGAQSSSQAIDLATTIDAGAFEVNRDIGAACVESGAAAGDGFLQYPGASGLLTSSGCTQRPSIVYADNQWFVAFPQNINHTTTENFSIVMAMGSVLNGVLQSLVSGVIDLGLATPSNPAVAQSYSSRYVNLAALSNGNVVAVYWLQNAAGSKRSVYASSYNAGAKSWDNSATLLSTANRKTDLSYDLDVKKNYSVFCRPQIAASGTKALAAWCEGDASSLSKIHYAAFSQNAWSTNITPLPGGNALVNPTDASINESNFGFSVEQRKFTFSGTPSISTGDAFASNITIGGISYSSLVSAVVSGAGTQQFNIASSSGSLEMCETLTSMIQALDTATTLDGSTKLPLLGYSIVLNPACNDLDPTTWSVTSFFNRGLSHAWQNTTDATDHTVSFSGALAGGVAGTVDVVTSFNNPYDWTRSSAVTLAGDGSGDFMMARSAIVPFMPVQTSAADLSTMLYARGLVGHEYLGSNVASGGSNFAGWKNSNSTLLYSDISPAPVCSSGTTNVACSARMPLALQSATGSGLVLFYQNQPTPSITSSAAYTSYPNRLWYTSYGIGAGFSNGSGIIDRDVDCSSASSAANDTPVCEGQSYGTPCQVVAETTSLPLQDVNTSQTIDHDVLPIAAKMNSSGTAIVAYHKKLDCTYVGTYVAFYDPNTGFGSPIRVDDGTGNTLHAAVDINSSGDAVVAWEQVAVDGTKVLYLRRFRSQSWQTAVMVNYLQTNPGASMTPGVGINESGQVIISYSYGASSSGRRQYSIVYQ